MRGNDRTLITAALLAINAVRAPGGAPQRLDSTGFAKVITLDASKSTVHRDSRPVQGRDLVEAG
jgi:hypothetical protein